MARQKVRAAARLLADAANIYDRAGHAYDRPALNAEILHPMADELIARIAEADRLVPLGC